MNLLLGVPPRIASRLGLGFLRLCPHLFCLALPLILLHLQPEGLTFTCKVSNLLMIHPVIMCLKDVSMICAETGNSLLIFDGVVEFRLLGVFRKCKFASSFASIIPRHDDDG